ncbi:MAG: hypothetical protein ABL984_13890 [Pyrinomonadaceae bacterium]
MKDSTIYLHSQRGSATTKFLIIFVFILMLAHAGYNYVPIAYNGASFRQEMDTAVVKGLAAAGQIKPVEAVTAHIRKAANDYRIPSDAVVEISNDKGHVTAHATYQQPVNILPFGIYKYNYKFDYTATPQGYLLKE